jgi:hypothetical protein
MVLVVMLLFSIIGLPVLPAACAAASDTVAVVSDPGCPSGGMSDCCCEGTLQVSAHRSDPLVMGMAGCGCTVENQAPQPATDATSPVGNTRLPAPIALPATAPAWKAPECARPPLPILPAAGLRDPGSHSAPSRAPPVGER